jgi:integrase
MSCPRLARKGTEQMRVKFTDHYLTKQVQAAADGKRYNVWDSHLPGLYIRVTDKKVITFKVQGRVKGQDADPVELTIGRFGDITLAQARTKAREALTQLALGVDPRRQAQATAQAPEGQRPPLSFAAIAEGYIRHTSGADTAKQIESVVRNKLLSRWGKRTVESIEGRDVAYMIDEVKKTSGEQMALQALRYAKALFGWALAYHCREWDEQFDRSGFKYNPARDIKPSVYKLKPGKRDRALNQPELRLLWQAVEDQDLLWRDYVRLLILLGVRRNELSEAVWSEFDLDRGVWEIPAKRMKAKEKHIVPLAPIALTIVKGLKARANGCQYVFTYNHRTSMNNFGWKKLQIDATMTELAGHPVTAWVFHDLRRSLRSGLSDLRVAQEVAELCIAHVRRGIVGVYDCSLHWDARVEAMNKWADRVSALVGSNVVSLPSAA